MTNERLKSLLTDAIGYLLSSDDALYVVMTGITDSELMELGMTAREIRDMRDCIQEVQI